MIYKGKIPVVVGVTGHRDIDGTDREELKREVKAALGDVRAACAHCRCPRCGDSLPCVPSLRRSWQGLPF